MPWPVHVVEDRRWNVDHLVLILAEGGAEFLHDADHREVDAFETDHAGPVATAPPETACVFTVSPITMTGVRACALPGSVKNRPSTTFMSRISVMAAATPMTFVSSVHHGSRA